MSEGTNVGADLCVGPSMGTAVCGILSKMAVEPSHPVHYQLRLGETLIDLNAYLNKTLHLKFTGKCFCQGCHRAIKKTYQDGYCFPCTQKLARCDLCIIKPERCHFHLGTCREPDWGKAHCLIPHTVYLANSTGIKVGITRQLQQKTRWIDQGASQALPLFEVPNRRTSGLVEVAIAQMIADKSNWRELIKGPAKAIDLYQSREEILPSLTAALNTIQQQLDLPALKPIDKPELFTFEYPIVAYPQKIATLSFDKTPEIQGTLLGIKGQYCFFEQGALNIRRHQGYEVAVL